MVLAAGALCAAALASAAGHGKNSGKSVVRDDVRETKALRQNGRVDIVKAIAAHHGKLLQFTVVVRRRSTRSATASGR